MYGSVTVSRLPPLKCYVICEGSRNLSDQKKMAGKKIDFAKKVIRIPNFFNMDRKKLPEPLPI